MKLSARNVLKGKVVNVVQGLVNTEVTLELPGGSQVVAIITKESAESLELVNGKAAYAIIKASNIVIGVD
jgi:molybdopterin-binding protein